MSEPSEVLEHDEVQQDGSVWAQMAQAHKAISGERPPLILELPGYAHLGIAVRYVYVPITDERTGKAAERLKKIKKPTEAAVAEAAAVIAMACDAIMVLGPKDPATGEHAYIPLPSDDGMAVKFDRRLCRGMGIPVSENMGAPAIVREVFGGAQGQHALVAHARELAEWMAGEREEIGEEFLGN